LFLTDPWQLFTRQHLDHTHAANAGLHPYPACFTRLHGADDGRLLSYGVLLHPGQYLLCRIRRNTGQQFSFVCHIERIEAQDSTQSPDFGPDLQG